LPAGGAHLQAPSVGANTVVRTAPISLSLSTGGVSAPNVGSANLFQSSNNVRLTLHANAAINTIFRVIDDGTGFSSLIPGGSIPTSLFNCDEAYAGQTTGDPTHNIIPVSVAGSLKIAPALTADGKLRIATVSVSTPTDTSGQEVGHSSVDACLQPHSLVDTPAAESHVTAFEAATGLSTPAGPVVSSSSPTTGCDSAFNAVSFPLAQFGEQEITSADPNATDPKRLALDPNVSVTTLTGEALIGTYGQ
jgi:hypothetical protein